MENISRRSFIKGTAISTATMAALGGTSQAFAEETAPASFEEGIDWSAEYDVVVIGCGFSGLMTSWVAAEAGQRVLILEKAPKAARGGNSRVTAGYYQTYYPDKSMRDRYIAYYEAASALGGLNVLDHDVLSSFADAVYRVTDWCNERGANHSLEFEKCGKFKQLDYEAVNLICEDARTQEQRDAGTGMFCYNSGIYNFFIRNVEALDNVDIWYNTPAVSLIQDPSTKMIHGVAVENGGNAFNVRAMDGVALCAGGFTANPKMAADYLPFPYVIPLGSTYNTGDGVSMASAAGAYLWHMNSMDGPDYMVPNPVTGAAFTGGTIRIRGVEADPHESNGFTLHNTIIVGANGTRFCDEATLPDHCTDYISGRLIYVDMSLPAWIVFNKETFDNYPVMTVWHTNDQALEDGVILSGDTVEELAGKINLPAETLVQTVSDYNQYCADGADPEFGRDAEYLLPLGEEGPYYAVQIAPSVVNTQGGPERNAEAQIVDAEGNPIPHLYGAGELGSIWGGGAYIGTNIADALAFGLIAGEHLGEKATDNNRDSMMESKEPVDFTEEPVSFEPEADNEFIGEADGIGGPIWVKVTVDDSKISDIEVLHNYETPDIGSKAIDDLPAKMVEAQGIDVDVYAGATATSIALKAAVAQALGKAGIEVTVEDGLFANVWAAEDFQA